jgi:hypothetical protein
MVSDPKALNFKPKLLCNFNRCLRRFTRFEHITHRANAPPIWAALRPAINQSINRNALGFIVFYNRATRLKVSLW